jgi:hypothetical protein
MAVRVAKIDAAAAVPVIELTVIEAPRRAAIGELRLADAAEDGIELGIADVEGVVVALELLLVVEKERERVVDAYRREMAVFRIGMEAKNSREKLRRCPPVAGRDDGVIEGNGHRRTSGYQTAAEMSAYPIEPVRKSCRSPCEEAYWKTVLDRIQGDRELLGSQILAIRAYGELGRGDEMVARFALVKPRLVGLSLHICHLFALAFSGRQQSVQLLLSKRLAFLESKNYWTAIAAKASGANAEGWRPLMERLASTTMLETFRAAAARHLTRSGPDAPVFSVESTVMIDATEQRLLRRLRPSTPVTAMWLVLIIVRFVVETVHGGWDSTSALIGLGALSPPQVLQNEESWRLATALFLHRPVQFFVALSVACVGQPL